jgi:hypothetical protein
MPLVVIRRLVLTRQRRLILLLLLLVRLMLSQLLRLVLLLLRRRGHRLQYKTRLHVAGGCGEGGSEYRTGSHDLLGFCSSSGVGGLLFSVVEG